MKSKNTKYIPRLDHLRLFAALLVVVYHFHSAGMQGEITNPLLILVKEGETGVSLFMILSGFILTRISLGQQIDYKAFIYNRVLRIYPLYLTMVFIAAFSGGRHIDPISFIALISPVGNLGNVMLPKFPHMWTISVEFQFYLIFPFVMAFFGRYGMRYMFGLIAFAIGVRALMYFTDGSIQDGAYWTILGRLDQFAIGMIIGKLYGRHSMKLSSPIYLAAAAAVLIGWIYGFRLETGGYYGEESAASPWWIFSPAIEGGVWAFMVLAYLEQSWEFPSLMNRALCFLGETSFSIYLWHYPILQMLFKHTDVFVFTHWYWDLALIVLPLVIAASVLSYLVIERPFFTMKKRYVTEKKIAQTSMTARTHLSEKAVSASFNVAE
jgi:peptidoglycan/LPS O-acetylase OafA/YrhL